MLNLTMGINLGWPIKSARRDDAKLRHRNTTRTALVRVYGNTCRCVIQIPSFVFFIFWAVIFYSVYLLFKGLGFWDSPYVYINFIYLLCFET